ncbi:hypothetical protein GQ42DRAFT_146705 [Ramicandelaber brevisporus]|nr:hypothetical protein GQ42DRAFT_146705 [Ramicandelaber brevisporus]
MLYSLEDFLISLESLPLDVQRNLKLLGDLDSRTATSVGSIESEVLDFLKTRGPISAAERTQRLRKLAGLFNDALKHSEDKLNLATQTYDIVDRHIRRLDAAFTKLDEEQMVMPRTVMPGGLAPEMQNLTSRRMDGVRGGSTAATATAANDSFMSESDRGDGTPYKRRKVGGRSAPATAASTSGGGGGAQGRGGGGRRDGGRSTRGNKQSAAAAAAAAEQSVDEFEQYDSEMGELDDSGIIYCHCKRPQFGQMIACDSDDCEIEWFHYECVGLTDSPEGSWYCQACRKRR